MKLEKELGSYGRWIVTDRLSFRTGHGGVTNAPDQIRDGKSGLVTSVVRNSAGNYTVTLSVNRPTTPRHLTVHATLSQKNTTPTQQATGAHYVDGSYSQSAGTFQIQVLGPTNSSTTTLAPVDPDQDCRINVTLVGSIRSVGQDAA